MRSRSVACSRLVVFSGTQGIKLTAYSRMVDDIIVKFDLDLYFVIHISKSYHKRMMHWYLK